MPRKSEFDHNELLVNDDDKALSLFVQNFSDATDLRCVSPEQFLELLEEDSDCPIIYLVWKNDRP